MSLAHEMAYEPAPDQNRAAFIAGISHDLRTPLMVLYGAADLLLRGSAGELTDEQRELVEAIRRSACTLKSVVEEALGELSDE
ncbi:MAG: hypothetical protein RLZZ387_5649 [Chloroflexota bacterium]|jgi:signal transduction histidine kinase